MRMATRYTEAELERGLHVLVLCGGSADVAAKQLEATGHRVPASTLRDWRDTHAERIEEIRKDSLPQIRERIAAEAEGLAVDYAAAERAALARAMQTLDDLPARDVAGAARNFATARGISIDKASVLRGMPSEIREVTPSAVELLDRIARHNPALVVDSDAEEIEAAAELTSSAGNP